MEQAARRPADRRFSSDQQRGFLPADFAPAGSRVRYLLRFGLVVLASVFSRFNLCTGFGGNDAHLRGVIFLFVADELGPYCNIVRFQSLLSARMMALSEV